MFEDPEDKPGDPGWVGVWYCQLRVGLDTQEILGSEGTPESGAVGRGALLAGGQGSETQSCSPASPLWGIPQQSWKLPEAAPCEGAGDPSCRTH